MNVLFVSAVFPYPLYSGGQVRIYNLLKRLGSKHSITLCTFIRDESERVHIRHLPFCSAVHTIYRGKAWQLKYMAAAAFTDYPFLFCTYANTGMKSLIGDLITRNTIDLIHIEPGYTWPSLPDLSLPVVVGEHNIEHEVYQLFANSVRMPFIRPLLGIDIRKMKHWEQRVWKSADRIAAVSDNDAKYIAGRVDTPLDIVPNGVDPSVLHFNPRKRAENASPVVLFVGNFSWLQNRDALNYILDDIWPRMSERIPKLKLRIVGRGIPGDLRQKTRGDRIELEEHAENIVSEFHSADALLAPIRIGGGTKFKILEAMACGLPVITSMLGFSGIKGTADREYLEAETPDQFIHSVQRVLTDSQLRQRITESARRLIENDYNWTSIADMLNKTWITTYEQFHSTAHHHHR